MRNRNDHAMGLSRRALLKVGCYLGLCFTGALWFNTIQAQEGGGPALPEGDGRQLVVFACSQCHGLKETAILRDGREGWKGTVDRMVLYGAQLSPAQADLVTRYLATELGPTSAVKGAAASQSPAAAEMQAELPAGPGRDLVATRCVMCHSLEKVVSSRRSDADWVSVTNNMVQRGMKATPEETQTMIAYLQANFSRDIQASPRSEARAVHTGEEVFQQRCASCHSAQQNVVLLGPSLYGEMKETHPRLSDAQVRLILKEGKGNMPSFKDILSKEDTDSLLTYLRTF